MIRKFQVDAFISYPRSQANSNGVVGARKERVGVYGHLRAAATLLTSPRPGEGVRLHLL